MISAREIAKTVTAVGASRAMDNLSNNLIANKPAPLKLQLSLPKRLNHPRRRTILTSIISPEHFEDAMHEGRSQRSARRLCSGMTAR